MAVREGYEVFGWSANDWTVTGSPTLSNRPAHPVERLGWLVMLGLNDYHNSGGRSARMVGWMAQCGTAADDSAWQRMIQVEKKDDTIDDKWRFEDSSGVAPYKIEKSIRIPYYVRKGNKLYVEYLLVGYHESALTPPATPPLNDWDFTNQPATTISDLGEALIKLSPGNSSGLRQLANWDDLGDPTLPIPRPAVLVKDAKKRRWEFRSTNRKIDNALRISYVNDAGKICYMFVGYEGGGAY